MKIELKNGKFETDMKDVSAISKDIAKNKHVKAVYLFGSSASGNTHTQSDIDLCIITDGFEECEYPITGNLDVSYFHCLPLSIQFRVLREGSPLVIIDKENIDNLKIKTMHDYIEFKYRLNKYLMERFKCTI